MDKAQQKKNSVKIEICDFVQKNTNIIDTDNTQLLCEYKVKYTPSEGKQAGEMQEIKIKIEIPISENCSKLDDFGVFVGIDVNALTWNATLSDNDKKEVLQYLMELKNELNTSNNKKENKDFLNALCIMIFYYAFKETRYYRNSELVHCMNEDDFKQYKKIIENTIKLREKENNKFEQSLSSANENERKKQIIFNKDNTIGDRTDGCGCLGNIWKKFCGGCFKENRNLNTKIEKSNIDNERINLSEG